MAGRFSRREVAVLYGVVLTCSLLFFVLGVFFGRGHQQEQEPSPRVSTAAREPVEDVQSKLGFYDEMLTPDDPPAVPSDQVDDSSEGAVDTDSSSDPVQSAEITPKPVPEPPPTIEVAQQTPAAAASPRRVSDASFTVQVGAYKTVEEARQVVLRLTSKGYDGKVVEPTTEVPFFRVCVGETPVRSETAALASRLKADGFNTYVRQALPGDASN